MIADTILFASVLGALYGATPGSAVFIAGLGLGVYLIVRLVWGWRRAVHHTRRPLPRPGRRHNHPTRTVRCGRTNRR